MSLRELVGRKYQGTFRDDRLHALLVDISGGTSLARVEEGSRRAPSLRHQNKTSFYHWH